MRKIRPGRSYRKKYSILPNKFLISLAVILSCFSALAAFFMYSYQKNRLEIEAFQKTELVMHIFSAMRGYVGEVLRPKMYDMLGHDAFVVEAMSSSYVTSEIMERFKDELPEFDYRRVAVNAKNPQSEANPQEVEMINYFNQNPGERIWQGIVEREGAKYFMRFSPVYFKKACLHCHGEPDQAPASIIERYGRQAGFFQSTDKISSVVSIGIPFDSGLERIKETTIAIVGIVFAATIFLYLAIWFFFNHLIVRNLHGILNIFLGNLKDDEGKKLFEQSKKMDEIEELTTAAEIISDHMQKTHHELQGYADNLELKVSERTEALRESEKLLKENIKSRNDELLTLNTITELLTQPEQMKEILPKVLGQILKVIPADGAGIYLLYEDPAHLELQCQLNADMLEVEFFGDLSHLELKSVNKHHGEQSGICESTLTQLKFIKGRDRNAKCLNVPLCCQDQVLGVIALVGIDISEVTPELRELLFSVGRQLGIAIENNRNIIRLLQSKELLQSIFDAITDFVVLLSNDGIVRMVNESLLKKYALNSENVLNVPIKLLAEKVPTPFDLFTKVLPVRLREPITEQVSLRDGSIFEIHFFPAFDDRGEPDSIVCYATDITLQKKTEQTIQQTEKLVAIGQLAAGIAHEVNNPIGIILCYSNLLKEDLQGRPKQLADLEIIEKHAQNCHRLVKDLLQFARRQKAEKRPASINDCIQGVVEIVQNQFSQNQVDFILDLQGDLPKINMASRKMKQVFMNMFLNASQAMEGKGFIKIITCHRKATAQIEVKIQDNGHGIEREVLDKVFDPYFTTKKSGEGTGLGLSVSYGIIQEHDGDIKVESTVGHGTEFTIYLPVVDLNNREID